MDSAIFALSNFLVSLGQLISCWKIYLRGYATSCRVRMNETRHKCALHKYRICLPTIIQLNKIVQLISCPNMQNWFWWTQRNYISFNKIEDIGTVCMNKACTGPSHWIISIKLHTIIRPNKINQDLSGVKIRGFGQTLGEALVQLAGES